jgi:hypothetical protein
MSSVRSVELRPQEWKFLDLASELYHDSGVIISLSGTSLQQVTRPTLLTNLASTCGVRKVLVRQLLHSTQPKSSKSSYKLTLTRLN